SAHLCGRRSEIYDDPSEPPGTIVAAADILTEPGATEVCAMDTHGVLADPAVDRLKNSVISRVVVTDTVPIPDEKQMDKLEVLSVANIIGDAIDVIFEDKSISELFGGENLA